MTKQKTKIPRQAQYECECCGATAYVPRQCCGEPMIKIETEDFE